jgi:phosphoribosylanthranilate isomerase
MWIKICGLTSAEAVTAALEHAVDALGFVFAESVRRVTPAQAAQLSQRARGRAPCVAVMRQPSQRLLDEVLAVFRPDVLQSDAADLAALRLPQTLALLPVLRGAPAASVPLPPRLLFEGARSGSGRTADWDAAQALAQRTQLVLAGGLTPGNVGEAIATVRPFGVDVSSGVEGRPGVKSPAAIGDFVQAVRAAARATGTTGDPL